MNQQAGNQTLLLIRPTISATNAPISPPKPQASSLDLQNLSPLLRAWDIGVLHMPLSHIVYAAQLDDTLCQILATHDHPQLPSSIFVVTSANAAVCLARHLHQHVNAPTIASHSVYRHPIYTVGTRTENTLKSLGFSNIMTAGFGTDSLAETLGNNSEISQVILCTAHSGRRKLVARLKQANKNVRVYHLYRNVPLLKHPKQLIMSAFSCRWLLATDTKSLYRLATLYEHHFLCRESQTNPPLHHDILCISSRIAEVAKSMTTGNVILCDNLLLDNIVKSLVAQIEAQN